MVQRFLLVGLVSLALSQPALAIPVQFSMEGLVTNADAGNAFNVSSGDVVSVHGFFDTDTASAPLTFNGLNPLGSGMVAFGAGTGNTLTVSVGDLTLFETDDVEHALGNFPALSFFNDGFDEFLFAGSRQGHFFGSFFSQFEGLDSSGLAFDGCWICPVGSPAIQQFTIVAQQVPEPAVLVLLMLCLGGIFVQRVAASAGPSPQRARAEGNGSYGWT